MLRLDNESLESYILNTMKPIQDLVNLEELYFMQNHSGSAEGVYIFSDEQGYHFVYSERGSETRHKLTDNLFEITYWTIHEFVSSIAFEMLKNNISMIENQREYIFKQSLSLMEKIGPNFKKEEEIRIDELIKENPY